MVWVDLANMSTNEQVLEYQFHFRDGSQRVIKVRLRKPHLDYVSQPRSQPPSWTQLTHCQCSNCPLRVELSRHCPVALNLVDVIETFHSSPSTDEAEVRILSTQRNYVRTVSLTHGISSLMGLIMVASGCPILDQLRPMLLSHLPFASIEETTYRFTSMYLLAQYFVKENGGTPDWELHDLVRLCESVGQVNQAFSRRLISINPKDASLNALANLDCFQISIALSVNRDRLRIMQPVFQAYLPRDGQFR